MLAIIHLISNHFFIGDYPFTTGISDDLSAGYLLSVAFTGHEPVWFISCQLSDFLQDTYSPILYNSENDFIQPNG